jgi:hypothetical protein
MNHLSTLHRYSGGFSNSGPGGVSLLTILFVVLGALASASAQRSAPILVAYAGQNETVGPMAQEVAMKSLALDAADLKKSKQKHREMSWPIKDSTFLA